MRATLSEIFKEYDNADVIDKEKVLLKYKHYPELKEIIRLAFTEINWYCKEVPDYNPDPMDESMAPSTILNEMKRFYIFNSDDPRSKTLTKQRKNELLIQMLESVSAEDADIIVKILTNQFDIDYLTPELAEKVWPNILPNYANR